MIEENETPGADPVKGGIEHDLLAQRRARRAELSDPGLIRRAETAEATVRTLETHLATLQQRLDEAASEQQRVSEQLADREREVRRVKQREYAEQQLRVEAEDRCERMTREKRVEVEELHRRLSVSERHARELVDQLEGVRRELSEAQQVAASERIAADRSEQELNDREAELERREFALEQTRVETERRLDAARELERRARTLREQAQESGSLLSTRLAALERRTQQAQDELRQQRQARESSERTLSRTQESQSGLRSFVAELERSAKALRGAIETERQNLQGQLERQREELEAAHAAELREELSQMTREHAAELQRNAQQTIDLQREREELDARYTTELEQMRTRVRALEEELEQTAAELRRHEALTHAMPAEAASSLEGETESAEAQRKREMTEALAAAVERLRARVANTEPPAPTEAQAPEIQTPRTPVPEVEAPEPVVEEPAAAEVKAPEPAVEEPAVPEVKAPEPVVEEPAAAEVKAPEPAIEEPEVTQAKTLEPRTPLAPTPPRPRPDTGLPERIAQPPAQRKSWLAPAIRSVALRHDAKLAGELISELLVAQRLVLNKPLSYAVEIDEVGSYRVQLDRDQGTVEKVNGPTSEKVDFLLKGPAAEFSEIAAGGAGRRLSGLKVRGSKRRARKLLAARRTPVTLAELAAGGIRVWPGLLLLAMAEAIDPVWTIGENFALAFQMPGEQDFTIYVCVHGGEPVTVTRVLEEKPAVTATLSEYALLCLLAGIPMPADEDASVTGKTELLQRFIDWTDRAQGLIATA